MAHALTEKQAINSRVAHCPSATSLLRQEFVILSLPRKGLSQLFSYQ